MVRSLLQVEAQSEWLGHERLPLDAAQPDGPHGRVAGQRRTAVEKFALLQTGVTVVRLVGNCDDFVGGGFRARSGDAIRKPIWRNARPPIMLANPVGATSPPDPGEVENSRPERSKVG